MKHLVWSALDHKIWKMRSSWPPFQRVLVAFSGGVDSLVLLQTMKKLASAGSFEVIAAYVHHGAGPSAQFCHGPLAQSHHDPLAQSHHDPLAQWRHDCAQFCESVSREWDIPFYGLGPSPQSLSSEEDFREFRYAELRKLKEKLSADFILTAHHKDDLLETRLLRLLRGTGPQGLEAMKPFEGDLGRPLLDVSKAEILNYAETLSVKPMEDPTNQDSEPLRNWIRRDLLPFIEARQGGLKSNLARSLQLMVEALQETSDGLWSETETGQLVYLRTKFLLLTSSERKRLIAEAFQRMDRREYSHGQIEEIAKRLDKSQEMLRFVIGGLLWTVDAKQFKVQKSE